MAMAVMENVDREEKLNSGNPGQTKIGHKIKYHKDSVKKSEKSLRLKKPFQEYAYKIGIPVCILIIYEEIRIRLNSKRTSSPPKELE